MNRKLGSFLSLFFFLVRRVYFWCWYLPSLLSQLLQSLLTITLLIAIIFSSSLFPNSIFRYRSYSLHAMSLVVTTFSSSRCRYEVAKTYLSARRGASLCNGLCEGKVITQRSFPGRRCSRTFSPIISPSTLSLCICMTFSLPAAGNCPPSSTF